jgi:adenylate cyclase
MFDGREKRLLRRALALYAGDHVLSRVERERERFLSPSAESAVLTMLFFRSWITTSTEPVGFETMFEWQRAYAEAVTRTFLNNHGIFDTFVGDDGSGWWNERDQPDHADLAVTCALALVRAIVQLNERKAPFPNTGIRIGIHTGRVGLGNYGSTVRLRYCPIGDAVNVASRLCAAMPQSGSAVIVSGATYDLLRERGKLAYLGELTKVGTDGLAVYGIGAEAGHAI